MGKYLIKYSKRAVNDLKAIKKSGRKLDMKKIQTLILELEENPRTGLGTPEQLKHFDGEVWSRIINKRDRLVYEIFESEISITVIQSLGHYNDK